MSEDQATPSADRELESAVWRQDYLIMARHDWPNYLAVAEELGITVEQAMALALLAFLRPLKDAMLEVQGMVAEFHRVQFPERWQSHPPEPPVL